MPEKMKKNETRTGTNKRNYQKELDQVLEGIQGEGHVPRLLLHACCAPCSSYVLAYLSRYFAITVFYYNPNITSALEYQKRVQELKRLLTQMPLFHPASFLEGPYEPEAFFRTARGLEEVPEGGERCFACYRLRLEKTAQMARDGKYDYFTTTLSISPLKNAEKINGIGEELAAVYGVPHLPSDFKKRDGYRQSIALSREYNLYRQDYCGCVYSMRGR